MTHHSLSEKESSAHLSVKTFNVSDEYSSSSLVIKSSMATPKVLKRHLQTCDEVKLNLKIKFGNWTNPEEVNLIFPEGVSIVEVQTHTPCVIITQLSRAPVYRSIFLP